MKYSKITRHKQTYTRSESVKKMFCFAIFIFIWRFITRRHIQIHLYICPTLLLFLLLLLLLLPMPLFDYIFSIFFVFSIFYFLHINSTNLIWHSVIAIAITASDAGQCILHSHTWHVVHFCMSHACENYLITVVINV